MPDPSVQCNDDYRTDFMIAISNGINMHAWRKAKASCFLNLLGTDDWEELEGE